SEKNSFSQMNIFLEEHQNILSNMMLNNVEFLLIGGYAVIFHGYLRSTGDMDIWVRPSNENKILLINALRDSTLIVIKNP
ncbi:MAG: hypothetical protein ABIR66_09215, partial [Saprospiraceae bacterium]